MLTLFQQPKPVIGCIHLKALPGSPLYDGKMAPIYEHALAECAIYQECGIDGLIIENFQDKPFFPDNLPPQTIAALSAVGREISRQVKIPVGVNALRNDALAALSIATAIEAQFIRVNVHMHAMVSDQGILTGKAYDTLRLKQLLKSGVHIWADVQSKHAIPLGGRDLSDETQDLCSRGLVNAVIVTGKATGKAANLHDIRTVKMSSTAPVLVGSGVTPENISILYPEVDGFIIGTYFKKEGLSDNSVDPLRVTNLLACLRDCRESASLCF